MTERNTSIAPSRLRGLAAALALGTALMTASLAQAQDAAPAPGGAPPAASGAPAATAATPALPDPKTVVATVGDRQITEGDLEVAGGEMAQQMQQQQVPQEFQRAYVLQGLINLYLVAKAAHDAKTDQSPDYQQLKSYFDDRALQRVFLSQRISPMMTQDAVKKAYDEYVKAFQPQDTVHAEHILVKTQDEANDIEKQLQGGAKFEDLAKSKSIDTGSASNGGDLGFFQRGQMVKPFEDAAFALNAGQVSQPVQSQFGWHIIKVLEKSKTQPAPLDQIENQLQQDIFAKAFDGILNNAKQGAPVTVKDSGLDAQLKQMAGPAPAGTPGQ
ncbi:MAG TPA: peptidylprolyl isomerase [Devosia sp.]|nr:peptidylprolyl isomerase [Devosia sp.]